MKTILIVVTSVCFSYGAFELSTSNSFLNGIANSTIATQQFFSAYLVNPAVSSAVPGTNVGITYFRPYGLSELNFAAGISSFQLLGMGSGIAINTFGSSLYHENRISINLSKTILTEKFYIGGNIHWYSLHVQNYGTANTYGIDIGGQYNISSQISTGFSVQNINQPSLNGHPEEIPMISNWGFSFVPDDHFCTYVAVQKDSWFPTCLLLGINFQANKSISIQSGFNTSTAIPALGIHLQHNWFIVNYSLKYHFDLGATHSWGISFNKEG